MSLEERRKLYAALAAPFPESAIQRTEARVTGRPYDTAGIAYQFICNRMNEVLGVGGWRAHRTVTVKEITTSKGRPAYEALCDLTLELGEWVNGDFVVFAESLADGGHMSTSEADARKGSYTNALKKAAAMFGCGRQAYEGTLDDDNIPSDVPSPVTVTTLPVAVPQHSAPGPQNGMAHSPPPAPSRNRLSSKQLAAIWSIGRKLGYEQSALRGFIKSKFSVQPEFLSRDQASQIISAMSEQANGAAADVRRAGEDG